MVIVGMNFGNKVELVKSLASVQTKSDVAFYEKLVNTTLPEISRLQSKRNIIAHNKWALGEGGIRGIRMIAKGKLKITDALVPIEELRADQPLWWFYERDIPTFASGRVRRASYHIAGKTENLPPSNSTLLTA